MAGQAEEAASHIKDKWELTRATTAVAQALAKAGKTDNARKKANQVDHHDQRFRAFEAVIRELCSQDEDSKAIDVIKHEYKWGQKNLSVRAETAEFFGRLAQICFNNAEPSKEADKPYTLTWVSLARTGLAYSWLLGASIWDRFDVFMYVAKELALEVAQQQLLNEPKENAD